jgi:stearoyl-CoA desaturase (delta-9 desaturase)
MLKGFIRDMISNNHYNNELYKKRRFEEVAVAFSTIFLPFMAFFIFLITLLFSEFHYSWVDFNIFLMMYVLTVFGITAGYHRYYTHRSFKTNRVIQAALIILGSMAAQGPLLFWVALHRKHHVYADTENDPHTPRSEGKFLLPKIKKFFHAHVGWMLRQEQENYIQYVPDLLRDKFIYKVSSGYFYWVILGLLLPVVITGLLEGTWLGFIKGLLVGGGVRIFIAHHVTWGINSICHVFGSKNFETRDESRNNTALGLLALGEGWHNNHHAFPTSAKQGYYWWELDISYLAIKCLSFFGLVSNIVLPNLDQIGEKKCDRE